MSTIKTISKGVMILLPRGLQNAVSSLSFRLFTPKLLDARAQYEYSDEHLKFAHILEAINYLRVAGVGGGCRKLFSSSAVTQGAHFRRQSMPAISSG